VPDLPPAPPYREYVTWLQRAPDDSPAFWRGYLAGVAEPGRLPLGGRPEPAGDGAPAAEDEHVALELSERFTRSLAETARRCRVTPNTLVCGAWGLLLCRYGGRDEVVVGILTAGRPAELPGADRIVGTFANTVPLRVRSDSEEAVTDWLRELLRGQAQVLGHQYAPPSEIRGWSEIAPGRPHVREPPRVPGPAAAPGAGRAGLDIGRGRTSSEWAARSSSRSSPASG